MKECTKKCPETKVCNPDSGRCVLKTGAAGKKVLGSTPSTAQPKECTKKCTTIQVCNPGSGRCVLKTGAAGKRILGRQGPLTALAMKDIIPQLPTDEAVRAWIDRQENLHGNSLDDRLFNGSFCRDLEKSKLLGPNAKIATNALLGKLVPTPGDSVTLHTWVLWSEESWVPVLPFPTKTTALERIRTIEVFRPIDKAHVLSKLPAGVDKETRLDMYKEIASYEDTSVFFQKLWWRNETELEPVRPDDNGNGAIIVDTGDNSYDAFVWVK